MAGKLNISKLKSILREAVSDYAENANNKDSAEWLQDYLGKKLPSKSVDVIHSISGEILETLDLMEQKQAAMNIAVESGQSAENWMVEDITKQSESNGSKARTAAEFFYGISSAQASYDDTFETEILEVSETSEEWNDSNWNNYKLKDVLKSTAVEAGKSGIREVASEVFLKASETGISETLSDREFITDTITKGAVSGLKTAISAGLFIAEESGIIPPTSLKIIATTAHKTIESVSALGDVIKGKSTITEALVKIKNTAVATFSGMWQQHKYEVQSEIIEGIGSVFGLKGAMISGVVNGLLTPKKDESRLLTVLKETGKTAVKFLNKEINIPFFGKNKIKALSRK